jgi:hypothetical protein
MRHEPTRYQHDRAIVNGHFIKDPSVVNDSGFAPCRHPDANGNLSIRAGDLAARGTPSALSTSHYDLDAQQSECQFDSGLNGGAIVPARQAQHNGDVSVTECDTIGAVLTATSTTVESRYNIVEAGEFGRIEGRRRNIAPTLRRVPSLPRTLGKPHLMDR